MCRSLLTRMQLNYNDLTLLNARPAPHPLEALQLPATQVAFPPIALLTTAEAFHTPWAIPARVPLHALEAVAAQVPLPPPALPTSAEALLRDALGDLLPGGSAGAPPGRRAAPLRRPLAGTEAHEAGRWRVRRRGGRGRFLGAAAAASAVVGRRPTESRDDDVAEGVAHLDVGPESGAPFRERELHFCGQDPGGGGAVGVESARISSGSRRRRRR